MAGLHEGHAWVRADSEMANAHLDGEASTVLPCSGKTSPHRVVSAGIHSRLDI